MNGSPEALVARARACLRRAIEAWNPTNPAGMETCREQLGDSLVQIRQVQPCLEELHAVERQQLRQSLAAFRHEIACAVRTLDSGAAIYRGMALRCRASGANYNSAGQISSEYTPVEHELQA